MCRRPSREAGWPLFAVDSGKGGEKKKKRRPIPPPLRDGRDMSEPGVAHRGHWISIPFLSFFPEEAGWLLSPYVGHDAKPNPAAYVATMGNRAGCCCPIVGLSLIHI